MEFLQLITNPEPNKTLNVVAPMSKSIKFFQLQMEEEERK